MHAKNLSLKLWPCIPCFLVLVIPFHTSPFWIRIWWSIVFYERSFLLIYFHTYSHAYVHFVYDGTKHTLITFYQHFLNWSSSPCRTSFQKKVNFSKISKVWNQFFTNKMIFVKKYCETPERSCLKLLVLVTSNKVRFDIT